MLCRFCKSSLDKNIEISSGEDSVNSCPECFNDIVELMENGLLESKFYKKPAKLGIHRSGIVEVLPNGQVRQFENIGSIRIDKKEYNPDLGRRNYNSYLYPYQRDIMYKNIINVEFELDPDQEKMIRYDRYLDDSIKFIP